MRKARLIWRIYPILFAVILLAIIVLNGFAMRAMRQAAIESEFAHLRSVARLVDHALAAGVPAGELIRRFGAESGLRITLIDAEGAPIADSMMDAERLPSQREQPEIAAALAGHAGSARRMAALGQETLFIALPATANETSSIAVVRAGKPIPSVYGALAPRQRQLALLSIVLALAAGAACYAAYRYISAPLQSIREGAERFARGDLATRVPVPQSEELGELAVALNRMAAQLHDRYASQTAHTYELEAVLSSMVEGVLAVDAQSRILKLNPAAAALLNAPIDACEGRILQEVVRNRDLNTFAARTLEQDGFLEGDIVLFDNEERYLQAHGAPLRDAKGDKIGAVIVLNDVTRLRRLEGARSEFAANVSHELRTPITSIIGYVETLQDGALESREDASRFLGIIAKQAQRLNALIEDLLALSRIERDSDTGGIELTEAPLHEPISAALHECAGRAEAHGIRLAVEGDATHARAPMNAQLLQQAFVNLIDNAIQHSDTGSAVRLRIQPGGAHIRIEVIDEGRGIAKEHLPRLFERFYRVDEDRDRRKGGTGLGLAIVKHVMRAHNGQVAVESEPGRGSTFTLTLPAAGQGAEMGDICQTPPPIAIIAAADNPSDDSPLTTPNAEKESPHG